MADQIVTRFDVLRYGDVHQTAVHYTKETLLFCVDTKTMETH
jgi:hypothetical protein